MKKVGIATFHFMDNFGAVLQCYALQKIINRFEGIEAEIIDYRPSGYRYVRVWTSEKEKILFQKKREAFENFLIQYCNMSPQRVSAIDGKGYDYCCVGSDQIWNPRFLYREYLLPNLVRDVCKIAYAPSIGCAVSEARLSESLFKEFLPSFKAISVREREHVEYVSDISGMKCECVLDPTLLLEADDYFSIIREYKKDIKEPYLLFYWLPHDRELFRGIELANMISRLFNLRIVHSIFGANGSLYFKKGECMYYEGVEDFLWYVKNASFIVTNSYHGTIFSLQFEVPFYSFIVESMMSRFDSLMAYTDIGDRIVTKMIRPDDINKDIDFKRIKTDAFKHRDRSIGYLKNALDSN